MGDRDGARLRFNSAVVLEGTRIGDSVAVNGCCLTVVELGPGWFAADVVDETLRCTNLVTLEVGDAVNLERPLRLDGRLGGHLVQGHVDTVGSVRRPAPGLVVQVDSTRYVVAKGSITVDGVSLTVVDLGADYFTVAVIPHTAARTTLGRRSVGEPVNLEFDLIAKYVTRLTAPYAGHEPTPFNRQTPAGR